MKTTYDVRILGTLYGPLNPKANVLFAARRSRVVGRSLQKMHVACLEAAGVYIIRRLSLLPRPHNARAHEGLNYCPHCFQSRGPAQVRARAERLTSPEDLLLYGNGEWPHYSSFERNELLANGNYLETEAISVRHGICGDPEQVRNVSYTTSVI